MNRSPSPAGHVPQTARALRDRRAGIPTAGTSGGPGNPSRTSPIQIGCTADGRHRRFARPFRVHGSARPGTDMVRFARPSPHEGCAARSPVVGCTPRCGWSLPPRCSHVFRPLPPSARRCAGRVSLAAPSPQSGVTRVVGERAVSRSRLIAGVTLGGGCRVRRVRGACLCLVACARDGRGGGHGAGAAAPERFGGARDRLEQPVRTWGGRLGATTGAAPGAVRITLPGGREGLDAGDNVAPCCGAPGRPPAIGSRPFAPAPLPANQPWLMASVIGSRGALGEFGPLGAQGFQVVSGPTVSR
jgi:hypothetical protein